MHKQQKLLRRTSIRPVYNAACSHAKDIRLREDRLAVGTLEITFSRKGWNHDDPILESSEFVYV